MSDPAETVSEAVANLRKTLTEFKQKLDDAIGDLEDDLEDLEEVLAAGADAEDKLETIAGIAGGAG